MRYLLTGANTEPFQPLQAKMLWTMGANFSARDQKSTDFFFCASKRKKHDTVKMPPPNVCFTMPQCNHVMLHLHELTKMRELAAARKRASHRQVRKTSAVSGAFLRPSRATMLRPNMDEWESTTLPKRRRPTWASQWGTTALNVRTATSSLKSINEGTHRSKQCACR